MPQIRTGRRLLTVALAVAASALGGAAAPAYAGPTGECRAFAVPPRQDGRAVTGEGGMVCTGPRGSITVEVCVTAFLWFAGRTNLGCTETTSTGTVSVVVGSVTVCPELQFPLVTTDVTATTDAGETDYAATPFTPAFCSTG